MTAYLVKNRPRQTQFRQRRAKPTGLIVVHTAESAPDVIGLDSGAENVAEFIRNRTDYGSYHIICDSDSRIMLVPFHLAAYGDGTGSNEFAIHISAATQADRWPGMPPEWREGTIRQMARGAANAAKWLKETHNITVPAVRVNRAQSNAGRPGFISHAERDPGRRSDPGKFFPWDKFMAEFKIAMEAQDDDGDKTGSTTPKHQKLPLKLKDNEVRFRTAHLSLQWSDTVGQQRADVMKLFNFAVGRKYAVLTGTEAGAGEPEMRLALENNAEGQGYRFFLWRSVWIAVNEEWIDGGWDTNGELIIPASEGVGKHTDKGIASATWRNDQLGEMTFGVAHYLTKGRNPGDPNFALNSRMANRIDKWADEVGKGHRIVFYQGDQNIPDNKLDTFRGGSLTSAADELKIYFNTGHGPIDVSASHDDDQRVRALNWQVYNDDKLFFHTDHFLCETDWAITPVGAK